MTQPFPKREILLIVAVSFIGLVVLPCLNAFVPPESIFHVTNFTINTYGKYLCYAVLALGVNLLWGYTGLLSLGQCRCHRLLANHRQRILRGQPNKAAVRIDIGDDVDEIELLLV